MRKVVRNISEVLIPVKASSLIQGSSYAPLHFQNKMIIAKLQTRWKFRLHMSPSSCYKSTHNVTLLVCSFVSFCSPSTPQYLREKKCSRYKQGISCMSQSFQRRIFRSSRSSTSNIRKACIKAHRCVCVIFVRL